MAGMQVGRPKETRASGHSGRAAGTGGTEPTIPAASTAASLLHEELRRRHPITAPGLARIVEQPRQTVRRLLGDLVAEGRAQVVGIRLVDPWYGEDVYEARPL